MKILICTGIYPPKVGGPAQYAKEVKEELERQGHSVKVLTFGIEHKMPPLFRHEYFFWRALFAMKGVDFILALDQFSVAWPTVAAAKVTRKKVVIRTGGDFLWETYVERTGDLVLFKDFYTKSKTKLNFKERFIFEVTKWTLQNAHAIAFSTQWQKCIFEQAYDLDTKKTGIVENFYDTKVPSIPPDRKVFIAGTRPLKWKNIPVLEQAFERAKKEVSGIDLDAKGGEYQMFQKKIQQCYAVILVSLGDISPNMILDAIRANKPFIMTRETGLYDRIKDIGIFVDPENVTEIKEKIVWLSNEKNYEEQKKKIEGFTFTHSWKEIVAELISLSQ